MANDAIFQPLFIRVRNSHIYQEIRLNLSLLGRITGRRHQLVTPLNLAVLFIAKQISTNSKETHGLPSRDSQLHCIEMCVYVW